MPDRRRVLARLIMAQVVLFASVIVVAWVSMWYAAAQVDKSERRWCQLIVSIADAPRADPGNDRSAAIAREVRALADEFGCREVK